MTSSENKDLPLKFLLKRYLQELSYVCELEVQVADKNYQIAFKREQLTDFDLVALSFEGDFSLRRVAAECKSGEDHALEQLLKLKGIMAATGIERGYFVKTRIHHNARLAADRLNIACLDENELRSILSNWSIDMDSTLRTERAIYQRRKVYDREMSGCSHKFVDYVAFEYWNIENQRNIHNLIYLLAANGSRINIASIGQRYFIHRIAHLFSLSLLRLCGVIYRSNFSDPLRTLQVELFGGARERRDREVLQDNVNKVLADAGRSPMNLEPEWVGDLAEVVARLLRSARYACNIPYLTIDFLENAFFDTKVRVTDSMKKRHDVTTVKLAQDMIHFLVKTAKLPDGIFGEFLEL